MSKMELYELLRKADGAGVDLLREGVRMLAEALMELEVAARRRRAQPAHPAAGDPAQRLPAPGLGHPGGHRGACGSRGCARELLPVAAGAAPAGRAGAGGGGEEVLCGGVSTRRVDDLVKAMGMEGISKSQVSRMCAELDEGVDASASGRWTPAPMLCGSTRFREGPRRRAGVSTPRCWCHRGNAEGVREMLGVELGSAEDGAFWTGFLRGLVARGLSGVRLVTSDAHQASRRRSLRCSTAQPGSAAASISCAMLAWYPGCPGAGRRPDPHGLRSAHGRARARSGAGGRRLPGAFGAPPGAGRGRDRRAGLPRLPRDTGADLEHQPARAAQQGDRRRTDVVGIFPNPAASFAWSGRCWPSSTTSGLSPAAISASTSSAPAWSPSSTARPPRNSTRRSPRNYCPRPHSS